MSTKLHAISDADGRLSSFFMTAGQVSDYIGAAASLDDLPQAQWLLGGRGYDADWFRDALKAKASQPHRDHVRASERRAPRRHSLRPLPNRLLLRRRARGTVAFWL